MVIAFLLPEELFFYLSPDSIIRSSSFHLTFSLALN